MEYVGFFAIVILGLFALFGGGIALFVLTAYQSKFGMDVVVVALICLLGAGCLYSAYTHSPFTIMAR